MKHMDLVLESLGNLIAHVYRHRHDAHSRVKDMDAVQLVVAITALRRMNFDFQTHTMPPQENNTRKCIWDVLMHEIGGAGLVAHCGPFNYVFEGTDDRITDIVRMSSDPFIYMLLFLDKKQDKQAVVDTMLRNLFQPQAFLGKPVVFKYAEDLARLESASAKLAAEPEDSGMPEFAKMTPENVEAYIIKQFTYATNEELLYTGRSSMRLTLFALGPDRFVALENKHKDHAVTLDRMVTLYRKWVEGRKVSSIHQGVRDEIINGGCGKEEAWDPSECPW